MISNVHDEGSVLMETGGRKCARTCACRCATSGSSLSSVRIACAKCTMPEELIVGRYYFRI